MKTLTLKVSDNILKKLKTVAEEKGFTRSEIVRNSLLEYLSHDDFNQVGSFLDLAGDLAGCVEGPSDLSTNKRYLEEYGQ
ncbi:MAG: hypothetical protein ISR89_07105 [Candidatus Marinimicrobia bacterium]|nr:hypothetical protein [Candidatus Neomarinimicrobiota bacterium]MBL7030916.1 hypothetical protein [Candidatus Neomarinimicrobiota bacterium]